MRKRKARTDISLNSTLTVMGLSTLTITIIFLKITAALMWVTMTSRNTWTRTRTELSQKADYNWFAGYASQFNGYTSGANYIYSIKLTGDCYNGTGTWLYNTNLDLNGHILAIDGNMAFMTSNLDLLDGVTLDLNGGQLLLNGEFNFLDRLRAMISLL